MRAVWNPELGVIKNPGYVELMCSAGAANPLLWTQITKPQETNKNIC